MHPRQREHENQWGRHPSIEHAVAIYRGNLHAGRTPTAYALEHAEYMAEAGERLLDAINAVCEADQAVENGSDTVDEHAVKIERHIQALETQGEMLSAMRNRIYEFRKRSILSRP